MSKQKYEYFQNGIDLSGFGVRVVGEGGESIIPLTGASSDLGHRGRSLVVVEYVSSLSESSVNNFDLSNSYRSKKAIDVGGSDIVEFTTASIDIDLSKFVAGEEVGEINIISFVETPLIGRSAHVDEEKLALLKFSDLQIFYVIFCKNKNESLNRKKNSSIYESYSHLGFVAVNVELFNNFLVKKIGSGAHNLLEMFTTTELAGELFAEGLMILCWGITPWVYTITSNADSDSVVGFPGDSFVACSGQYILSREITEISVIPGSELSNWDTNRSTSWPKLDVAGAGNMVQLDLRIPKAVDRGSGNLIPFPYFNIVRKVGDLCESNPILNFNIFDGV
ncbi:hypothetical protein [Paraburkholderia sp. J67]|uniref:hypothetical protein n=1 Tax=Paraburkholderia sp. J67 TaxID=2805435 RepID=UPI002ABD903E|nr:hypothetical protein [Paraburkholderia sp. J67]